MTGIPQNLLALVPTPAFAVGRVSESPRDTDWRVWQWVDSAFPAGGFAHSGGLEAAVQLGEVRDRVELDSFFRASLDQAGCTVIPFLRAAHQAPERLTELDTYFDAFCTNHVANRASRLQGRALLIAAERIFEVQLVANHSSLAGHLGPLLGAMTSRLEFSLEVATRLALFWHLRGLVAAAVRLNLIGPLEGQKLQFHLAPFGEEVRERCSRLELDDIAQTAPLQDLWQSVQDRLPMRLFQS